MKRLTAEVIRAQDDPATLLDLSARSLQVSGLLSVRRVRLDGMNAVEAYNPEIEKRIIAFPCRGVAGSFRALVEVYRNDRLMRELQAGLTIVLIQAWSGYSGNWHCSTQEITQADFGEKR